MKETIGTLWGGGWTLCCSAHTVDFFTAGEADCEMMMRLMFFDASVKVGVCYYDLPIECHYPKKCSACKINRSTAGCEC